MQIPDQMWYYGWDSAGNYVQLGPGDEIPDMLMQMLSPLDPVLATQPATAVEAALQAAMAPGPVLAQAANLVTAAAKLK